MLLETPEERLVLAVDSALAMVPAAVWAAAAVAVVWGAHRRRVAPALLAGAALAWAVLVVVMAAQFGYAAIGRFYAPAAALLCVLAGVAVGWLAGAAWALGSTERTPRWLGSTERTRLSLGSAAARGVLPVAATAAVLAVVAVAAAPSVTPRLAWLPAQLAAAAVRADAEADLVAFVAAAAGRDGLLACGPLSVDATRPAGEVRPRLAWMLDLPMAGVRNSLDNGPGITVMRSGTLLDHTLALRPPDLARPLLRSRDWVAYAEYCPVGLPRG